MSSEALTSLIWIPFINNYYDQASTEKTFSVGLISFKSLSGEYSSEFPSLQ